MVPEKVIPVTIALPKPYRDLLRKIALEESLKNPDPNYYYLPDSGGKFCAPFCGRGWRKAAKRRRSGGFITWTFTRN